MQAQVDVAELVHLESIEAVADLLSIKQHRDQSMSGAQLHVGARQGLAEADFAVVDEGILVAIYGEAAQVLPRGLSAGPRSPATNTTAGGIGLARSNRSYPAAEADRCGCQRPSLPDMLLALSYHRPVGCCRWPRAGA